MCVCVHPCRGYELLQTAAEAGNNKAKAALAYGYLVSCAVINIILLFECLLWCAIYTGLFSLLTVCVCVCSMVIC